MPLPRYGVAIGTYVSFVRDPQDQYGRWYHGHLTIDTPGGQFQSALDVDTPSGVGVSYRVSHSLAKSELGVVATLPGGWHDLASDSSSGALDYLRSPLFQDRLLSRLPIEIAIPQRLLPIPDPAPLRAELEPAADPEGDAPESDAPESDGGVQARTRAAVADAAARIQERTRYEQLPAIVRRNLEVIIPRLPFFRPWIPSTGDNALSALEAELSGAARIYLFGDHYESGLGVHDVHMNQGDPLGSQWWSSDGIWQDGAVCIERANGTIFAWQVKFNSQSFKTDSSGHPA